MDPPSVLNHNNMPPTSRHILRWPFYIMQTRCGLYIVFNLVKGMVHLTQDMASDDDFGPPEYSDDGQTAILCKKHAYFTLLCVQNLVPPAWFYICN